jgi:hypothetical protein
MMSTGPLVAAALSLIAVSEAGAQDPEAKPFKPTPEAGFLETFNIDGEVVGYVRGLQVPAFRIDMSLWAPKLNPSAQSDIKEFSLRADRAILWARSGTGGDVLDQADQLYLEGNVVFIRKDIQTQVVEIFRAERFYLDLRSRAGYFLDVRVSQVSSDDSRPAVTLRAKEARLVAGGIDRSAELGRVVALGLPGFSVVSPGRLVAFDIMVSTCTYGDPHYHVGLSEAKVDWRFPAAGAHPLFGFIMGKPEGFKVGGRWVTVNIWGVPVFVWPYFELELAALTAMPLKRVQGGRSGRFGNSVETTWGLEIRKGLVDLGWEVDWRQKRGWAGGIDPSWTWDRNSGYLDTYYMRDDGPDPSNDFDRRFLPLERRDRGRARFFHRFEVTPKLRLEGEGSWLSDRNFLEEMLEKEFKEGKEQETVAYLRYLDGNRGGFLMHKVRINDFQTQLEYLPRAKGVLADEPVLPGLPFGWTFNEDLEIVNLNQRFDDDLGLPDQNTWRFDSLSSWVLSVPLGVATLSPFAEARVTAWEEALDGDPSDRFIATAGAKLATDIHKDYDVQSDFLGLHRLRHIMHIEARAVTAFSNTLEPAELFPYDGVDGFDDFTEFSLEVRNLLQTKVIDGESFQKKDFLGFGAEIEYYPDAPRDTVGFKASNFAYPFNWITLGPHDATKVLEERTWSNIHWDFLFRPSNYLEARGNGEYNPVHKQEEVRQYTITARPYKGLELSIGQVFVFDVTNAFTVSGRWDLTEKWRLTAESQFDYKADDYISRKAAVSRDFHDFRFEAVFEEDTGRDERRFYVTFVPTFLRISK